jgi:bile acid:Na+ symporter, BASS family
MKEQLIEILKIVAPLSVVLIMFAQGLGIAPSEVARQFKGRSLLLLLRAFLAMTVLVPAAALAIILLLKAPLPLAIGLAILVACPPAPVMLKNAVKSGGDSAFMASMHLLFAGLAFLTVPAIISILSGPLGFHADVHVGTMMGILAKTILLPVMAGMVVHGLFRGFAAKAGPLLGKVGAVGLLLVVLVAVAALYPTLLNMDAKSYLIIALVSLAALAIGHFLGPDDPAQKTAMAVECGVRHPVLALTIAGANFTPQQALPVLVPCIVTFIVFATIYMKWRGKSR